MSGRAVPGQWFVHPGARNWRTKPIPSPLVFHRSLPGYVASPLTKVPRLADQLGLGSVFIKDESSRLGLPAFKILGASYAISRALSERFGSPDPLRLDELAALLESAPNLRLVTATDGNHGRAVAHVAGQLGLSATILHPVDVAASTVAAIRREGAETVEVEAPYDDVVQQAAALAGESTVVVQDTAWPGYRQIPQWIVEGYTTLCFEIDNQLASAGQSAPDLVVVPAGVGSLAQAVLTHYRSTASRPAVLIVEPDRAPSVTSALKAGAPTSVQTRSTVMTGLNCGTVSELAWPVVRGGADAALTVSDAQAIEAVAQLAGEGVDAGPCGAATLAGLKAARDAPRLVATLGLGPDSTVVLINTESLSANPLTETKAIK